MIISRVKFRICFKVVNLAGVCQGNFGEISDCKALFASDVLTNSNTSVRSN